MIRKNSASIFNLLYFDLEALTNGFTANYSSCVLSDVLFCLLPKYKCKVSGEFYRSVLKGVIENAGYVWFKLGTFEAEFFYIVSLNRESSISIVLTAFTSFNNSIVSGDKRYSFL